MDQSLPSLRLKRLLYRSWHRGCKETDLLLGDFAKAHLHTLTKTELDSFEQLLEEQDLDVYSWLTGKLAIPVLYQNSMMDKIQQFHRDKHSANNGS